VGGSAINSTWEQITAPTGSFLQDAINFVDNAFLGTLSTQQKGVIDQTTESQIQQAAAGNTALANSEISQYQNEVNSGVYSGLPSSIENLTSGLIQYAPWIVGIIALIYALPWLRGLKR
jgi:hypothetical protein